MTEERQNEKAQRLLGKLPDFLDLKKEEELERKEILVADSQLEMLKRQLEVCDSIGEEVLKEYQETKERFIFLKEETKDIKETEKTLRKMIKELDKEINTRFSLTLEKVNGKFQKYFEIIFGGGQAELVLVLEEKEETEKTEYSTEEQNMPQGIEIKMSLPRKRIKSTSMLSGGEKTLTSLALLFAIISSNPPPFVLLDEVDASLDETNSANFTKVVKNMARHSQFIVITHNREIMKEVRLLYGVTLRKDGTSQLLSVDLEKRTPDNS
jgi:chromosome segregation protein